MVGDRIPHGVVHPGAVDEHDEREGTLEPAARGVHEDSATR